MRKYRIIILGAGFSRSAGLPLAPELWEEIRRRAHGFGPQLRASKFNDDLRSYIEFRRNAAGEHLTPESVDFEDFMRFLDIEHYLGLRGGETWSDDGNEGTVVTKYLIGKIIADRLENIDRIPEVYLEFARRLEPDDIIITFNYDTLLERALEEVGKPYRLFPDRFKEITEYYNIRADDHDEVLLLKMHGSIDWFDRSLFEKRVRINGGMKLPPPYDFIFSRERELDVRRIVDGPRSDQDPLYNTFRVRNLKKLYSEDFLFNATPRILPPSAMKILYSTRMNDFWEGMGNAGLHNFGMAIIGFSLPQHDEYARQILYSLVRNYQNYNWGSSDYGLIKSNLAIVDLFNNAEAEALFRSRYCFVDWSRADLYGSGFDLNTLKSILT